MNLGQQLSKSRKCVNFRNYYSACSALFYNPLCGLTLTSLFTVAQPIYSDSLLNTVNMATSRNGVNRFILLLVLLNVRSCLSDFNLTILHTNDCHTRFEETNAYGGPCDEPSGCFGGVARRATALRDIRERESMGNVLLLDAGDQFQGTDWFYVYKGNATAHFMNLLGYDAMVLGNHEFDNGIDDLLPFLQNVTFPILSCNIDASNEPRMRSLYVCSHVFEMGGEKVGVVGYTLKSTPDFAITDSLVFNDEIPAVQEKVNELLADGINKIIALGHAGLDIDQEVARSIEGVDIVVGGHSNTFLYTGDPPSNDVPAGEYPYIVHPVYNETASILVIQAYAYGKYLGYLNVVFDDNGVVTEYAGNPILLDATVEKDPSMQAVVEVWKNRVDEVSDTVIGSTSVRLDGQLQLCGTSECNLGNLLADAMLQYSSSTPGWQDANIALTTAGSIMSSIQTGDITTGDLILVMPYGNTIDQVRLSGQHLLEALEVAMVNFDPSIPSYAFPQVSGLRIEYDLTRDSGDRVYGAQFQCRTCTDDGTNQWMDIDPEVIYDVIMNSYMAGGGGGYGVVRENKLGHINGENDVYVTSVYVEANSPLNVEVDDRIILYDDDNRPSSSSTPRPPALLTLSSVFAALLLSMK